MSILYPPDRVVEVSLITTFLCVLVYSDIISEYTLASSSEPSVLNVRITKCFFSFFPQLLTDEISIDNTSMYDKSLVVLTDKSITPVTSEC